MHNKIFVPNGGNPGRALTFRHFNRKGWSLFSALHREVRIGILAVATLTTAAPRLMAATGTAAATLTTAEAADDDPTTHVADTLALAEASVTASRAPMSAALAARPVTVLRAEDFQAAGITSVNDILKCSAGVDVRQRGAFGIQTDISIDGGTHDQITILLNGVSLVNPQTGHNAADFPVNISDIERIEILEGAASAVCGSQAFSGAINIVTKKAAASASPLELRLEAADHATFRGEARTVWAFGNGWTASASGSYQRSDGAVTNGDFKGGKGFAQLTHRGRDFLLDLQIGATANDFGANTFYSAAYPNQWEATRRYLLSARAETTGRVHLAAQASWLRNLDHFQLIRDTQTGENFNRSDVFTAGLNAWTQWQLGRTAVGAEIREDVLLSGNLGRDLDSALFVRIPHGDGRYYTKRADRTNVSYFAEHSVLFRNLTATVGVMAERNNAIDHKFRFYPHVDLSYRPADGWRLYASWNKALRLPSFTDLWYKSATQEGNVGLRPEECSAFRLGAAYTHGFLSLQVKGHYRHSTNMIDWVMRSADDIYHATSFTLSAYGAGLDAALDLQQWWGQRQPFERLTLSYAWMGQHRAAGEPYYKSNYALEYLRHKFVAHLSHRIAFGISADWTLRVQQREGSYLVYENLVPTADLRPYGTHALLDLRLRWTHRRLTLRADLTNLTNHRYYDIANVRQAGFGVMGGVEFKL